MARINDVGGTVGFGAIDTTDDPEPFHTDWEARVAGLLLALRAEGLFYLDEFRDAIESIPPARYLTSSYYERWFTGFLRGCPGLRAGEESDSCGAGQG
ncbi:hypothetical protein ACIBJF_05440 [Streptomyces sp. NPDC050743]|uniref:hypothetical protein n=1 Tax=Streptomyces sp. NPDC050743 TaxID=3365634 RepID=UPI0037927615